MLFIDVITMEEGPFNPGTPRSRGKAAVPNAENFVIWLESMGWERTEDQPNEDVIRLKNGSSEAKTGLDQYASKPFLKDATPAWKVFEE